ncbi:MAG TPA: ATP-binding cassette domain-containing protein [Solirubrobacteraceae bacterium]|nr:ATP-binding cassette domain-containing protein [Solirubrobacteraceae bacterium]
MLELKDVGRVFRRGARLVVALDRVCLAVERGECVAVYGASRSGKTTLLRIAAGEETSTSGSVRYEGKDLGALSERLRSSLLRSEVSWVPASLDFHPSLSVLEQVTLAGYMGSRDHARSEEEARAVLKLAGIEHCAEARACELSDGELRLTALAQGIVKRPRLLLADVPANSLDPIERNHILELLRGYASEHSAAVLFSAAHADETLRCSRLVRLDAGRLTVPSPPPARGEVIEFPARKAAGDVSDA